MQINFFNDPGHGWLEISVQILEMLGIKNKISRCSYLSRDGKTAYLEEDCDAGFLIDALKEKQISFSFKEIYQERTFIRDLPNFS